MKATRWSLALLLSVFAGSARAVDITACGDVVPAGAVGVLQNDLDCGGDEEAARCLSLDAAACVADPTCTHFICGGILVGNRATLLLNGHTVSNGTVTCPGRLCTVSGPGSIVGGYGLSSTGKDLVAKDLEVRDGEVGLVSYHRRLTATNVTVSNVPTNWGMYGSALKLSNVTVSGCQLGMYVSPGAVKGTGVTVTDNSEGGIIAHAGANLTGATVTGNGSAAEGYGGIVVPKGRLRLENSVATGNFRSGKPVDLSLGKRPKLIASTCDHSVIYGVDSGPGWGVCSGD